MRFGFGSPSHRCTCGGHTSTAGSYVSATNGDCYIGASDCSARTHFHADAHRHPLTLANAYAHTDACAHAYSPTHSSVSNRL